MSVCTVYVCASAFPRPAKRTAEALAGEVLGLDGGDKAVCLFVCLFVCLLVCLFVCLFVCLGGWLVGWFVRSFVGWLVGWLFVCLLSAY